MGKKAKPINEIISIEEIENRESQLWWLAVLVIILLSIALFVVDWTNSSDGWWISPNLEFVLNTSWMRIVLITSVLLICTYFRDSTRQLRRRNNEYSSQLERKKCQAEKLRILSDKLINESELKNAFNLIIDVVVEITNADAAFIMLRESRSNTFARVVSRSEQCHSSESLTINVDDAIKLIEDSNQSTSKLAVPIHLDKDLRGVICIERDNEGTKFNDEDLGVLTTLSNQASLMIQKMDLLDDLHSKINKLAQTLGELNQTQKGLIQSEKLASIGQLAGGFAHEINNPLQVVLGRTQLVLNREVNEKNMRDLNIIIEHTTRIANTVSNILSFSRQSESSMYRNLDISIIVSKTLELLEPQMIPDDIVVIRGLQKDLPPVYGNSGQLQQVFTNLILNAYQAMRINKGGELKVETWMENDHTLVSISDNGPGISPENIEHIFEPFFTTKPEGQGTGLGLSIVYGIVQSHKGNISVESDENGTCFTVKLPAGGYSEE